MSEEKLELAAEELVEAGVRGGAHWVREVLEHDIWYGNSHTQQVIFALCSTLELHFLQNLLIHFLQFHFAVGLSQ